MKDDKYWARRRKNNMAAKRSRDARRVKENQIAMRAAFLEKEVVSALFQLKVFSPNTEPYNTTHNQNNHPNRTELFIS